MRQYKRKRTRTPSPDPDARKNARSLAAAKKKDTAHNRRATTSVEKLIDVSKRAEQASKAYNHEKLNILMSLNNEQTISENETLQSSSGQPSEEEKSDESSGEQSDEKEKNSEKSSEQSGEEKSGEGSSDESSEEEKDGESNAEKSSEEGKSGESGSEHSGEKEKEDRIVSDDIGGDGNSKGTESSETRSLSVPDYVKIIFIEKYKFKTHLNVFGSYDSKINARVGFGAQFVEFRKILISQHIENDFKETCFGHFLKLDENVAVQLPMKLVHGLCLRRIFSKKKKEVWFDYNGLSICFGINEFAVMTGLRCHSLPPLSQQLAKIGKEGEKLVDIVGKSANAAVLIEKMQDPKLTKKQKVAFSVVWFLHCILCSKSAKKTIETHWLKIASNKNIFDSYPWGRISFDLTISYLLKKLDPTKSQYNLHGFPWAFAAWAFEAIPAIQRLSKDPSPERSFPRMIRWMAVTPAHKTTVDPIDQTREQMQNQVVHPFLFPTNIEKEKIFVQDIEPYEDCPDPEIDVLKDELALVTTIKMDITCGEENLERVGGENSVLRNCGVERDSVGQIAFDIYRSFGGVERGDSYTADLGRGGDTPDMTQKTNVNASNVDCCCKCQTCCDKYNVLLNEVKSLSTKLDGQQPKRTIYPSYARKSPYTPVLKRILAMNSKAKHARTKNRLEVNLYKPLDVEKREAFNDFISKKEEERKMYLNDKFNYQDLMNMTDPYFLFECKHVNEILSLMRKRQIWFPRHYNQTDLILDLNLYNTLYDQYKNLSDKGLVNGALPMHEALTLFEMDSDILKYCSGERPYPYGRKWNGTKRIYTVMNIKNTHFIALEFLMEKGLIQVYDCNIHACDEPTFLTLIRPILELWPKLLKQSGVFNHLPEKLLNDAWSYERLKDIPRNNSCAACGPYACVFIDHLLTGTDMTLLNDNEVDNFRIKYAVAVLQKELNP